MFRSRPIAIVTCLIVLAASALGGCAAPATVAGMSVEPGERVAAPAVPGAIA